MIFVSTSFNICLAAQKNHLMKMGLLSTHNIMFWLKNTKNIGFDYTLLLRGFYKSIMYIEDLV